MAWRAHPGKVQPVHRHGQGVDWLLVRQGPVLLVARLEAGDEDDDSDDDADDDGGGGGDDDVVQPLALPHTLRSDLAALGEGHVRRSDLHLLKADDTDNDALIVRHILDLELALTGCQGWPLLELGRTKQPVDDAKTKDVCCFRFPLDHY